MECLVDLQVDAFIPEEYIHGLSQRLDIYRRIAGIQSVEDSRDVLDELIDRFGDPPKPVEGLIEVSLLRGTAASLGIREINQKSQALVFQIEHMDMDRLSLLVQKMKGRVFVNAGTNPYLSVRMGKNEPPLELTKEVLKIWKEAKESK